MERTNFGDHIKINTEDERFSIEVKLPPGHRKWIARINGSPELRKIFKQEIEESLSQYVFNDRFDLAISFLPTGAVFQTSDNNGCVVGVAFNPITGYCYSNIGDLEYMILLKAALSAYLPRLYSVVKKFENEAINLKEFPPLDREIIQTITLKRLAST